MRWGRGESLVLVAVVVALIGGVVPAWAATLESLSATSSRLSAGDTMKSPSGHFELGIFAYPAGSERHYLCIRYSAPIEQVVVWVANRDIPLSENSYIELSLPTGNLQLFDPNNNVAQVPWSTNANAGVAKAVVLDSGNLVLVDSAGYALWDSFKNSSMTDTLLPGTTLTRSANGSLVSWLTKDDPSTGNGTYKFGWGVRANASILELAWTSPKEFMNWTGGPYIPATDEQNPHIISTADSVYFDTTVGNLYFPSSPADTVILSGGDAPSATTLKRLTLDTDGGLRIWQWVVGLSTKWSAEANWVVTERGSACYALGACGAFGLCEMDPYGSVDRVQCTCPEGFRPIDPTDVSAGCTPIVPLSGSDLCNSSKVNLLVLDGKDMPFGGDYRNLTGAASVGCAAACLKDCNCAGAVYSKKEQYCWMKMTPLFNLGYLTVKLHGTDRTAFIKKSIFQPPVPNLSDRGDESSKDWMGLIVGISVSGVAVLVALVLLWICCFRVRRGSGSCEIREYSGSETEHVDPPVRKVEVR